MIEEMTLRREARSVLVEKVIDTSCVCVRSYVAAHFDQFPASLNQNQSPLHIAQARVLFPNATRQIGKNK